MTKDELAQMIDHTNLHAYATVKDMEKLCFEAKSSHFKMVAINPVQTKLCKKLLEGTDIHVGAAVGFPLGQETIETKCFITKDSIQNGADEIDYVINITELKEKNYEYLAREMRSIKDICHEYNVICKVIFENCYLSKEEIAKMAEIALEVRPDFIKTSTGFGTGGALVEDVKLMKSIVKENIGVKAAGGIRTYEDALKMIEAGATRIGTSKGVEIIQGMVSLSK